MALIRCGGGNTIRLPNYAGTFDTTYTSAGTIVEQDGMVICRPNSTETAKVWIDNVQVAQSYSGDYYVIVDDIKKGSNVKVQSPGGSNKYVPYSNEYIELRDLDYVNGIDVSVANYTVPSNGVIYGWGTGSGWANLSIDGKAIVSFSGQRQLQKMYVKQGMILTKSSSLKVMFVPFI